MAAGGYAHVAWCLPASRTSQADDGDPKQPAHYTVNNLNQYTGRENNTLRVLGTAQPGSTVAAQSADSGGTSTVTVTKLDRNFAASILPSSTSGPVRGSLTVTATLTGAGTGGADLRRTDSRNWFAAARAQSFSYDQDGNLTGDGVWTYTYDGENQLVRMQSALPAGFGFTRLRLDFKYDYLGRRVEKRVFDLDANTETLARRFIYDGWNLIAETDVSGSILRSYTWGLDLAGSLNATGGVGALLQITNHNANNTRTSYFPSYDGNGNVVALTREDGTAAAVYEYSPFGELIRKQIYDSAIADSAFRFSTKFTDDESGLIYYGARYYSSSLGRFINRDPIAEQGGLNLYGFCGNDGVNHTDYLGYSWLSRLLKAGRRAIHQVTRALLPIRALRSMDRRLERWEDNHQQELKIAAAIVAAIVTYELRQSGLLLSWRAAS